MAKRKPGKDELRGIVAQHAKTVAETPPSQPEFWHALFGWAQHSSTIVLLDPLANFEHIKHNVMSHAEKDWRDSANRVFAALTELRSGHVTEIVNALPLARDTNHRRFAGLWDVLNPRLATSFNVSGYTLQWTQGGKARILLTERLRALQEVVLRPDDTRQLYEAFPSCSAAQEAFVQQAASMTAVAGRPRTLAQLGRVRNAELRRCLVSVYGVKETGDALQRDDYGALYNVDDATNAVHVTCPSTGREYWLGVPATCETAREAVLWSFGLGNKSANAITTTWDTNTMWVDMSGNEISDEEGGPKLLAEA